MELLPLRMDVNSRPEDLTGYPDFRESVDNQFPKVFGHLEAVDEGLQADDPIKDEPRGSSKAYRTVWSTPRWTRRDHSHTVRNPHSPQATPIAQVRPLRIGMKSRRDTTVHAPSVQQSPWWKLADVRRDGSTPF